MSAPNDGCVWPRCGCEAACRRDPLTWTCDECACAVRVGDFAKGAIRRLVEPDNAFGGERYETLCEVCADRPDSADRTHEASL